MSDRANRLRERRNKSKEAVQSKADKTDEPSETPRPSKQSKPSKPSQTDKPGEMEETGETDKPSIKDEQVGTYLYLPEAQKKEMGLQYKILSAEYEREFGKELEKNRHFYPLVIEHGLDGLDGLDVQEVRDLLDGLDY
ncbi:hypothetical protein ACFQO4_19425 [Saliphagus sp. GCM10025334]|uniref:hypothetical protein n=1 Tax=Natronosalvus caseinilyticus TaxID=2953747 RepID=UPI0028AB1EA3|nr:hypothetical protein [Natronosalvus caseinilyticus]